MQLLRWSLHNLGESLQISHHLQGALRRHLPVLLIPANTVLVFSLRQFRLSDSLFL